MGSLRLVKAIRLWKAAKARHPLVGQHQGPNGAVTVKQRWVPKGSGQPPVFHIKGRVNAPKWGGDMPYEDHVGEDELHRIVEHVKAPRVPPDALPKGPPGSRTQVDWGKRRRKRMY